MSEKTTNAHSSNTNANTQLIVADYLPAAEISGVTLEQRAENIRGLLNSADETHQLHMGYVAGLGRQLLMAKAQLGHGKFLPWIDKTFPDQGQRTLRGYMQFIANAAARSTRVRQLLMKPVEFTNGRPSHDLQDLVTALYEITDGKSYITYLRDTGRLRDVTPQSKRDNKKKVTPEETEAALNAAANDLYTQVTNALLTLADDDDAQRRATPAARKALKLACVTTNKREALFLKSESQKPKPRSRRGNEAGDKKGGKGK